MTTSSTGQRDDALQQANSRRRRLADIRRRIRNGDLPMTDVLAHPPAELHGEMLTDVLLLAPQVGYRRIAALGRQAAKHQINLVIRLGDAPDTTRRWITEHLYGLPRGAMTFPARQEATRRMIGDVEVAGELVAAIREHRHMVTSRTAPPSDFGAADHILWRRCDTLARRLRHTRPHNDDDSSAGAVACA